MTDYRLCFLDDEGYLTRKSVAFESADDAAAVQAAEARCEGRAMELWADTRLVRMWHRPDPRAPLSAWAPPPLSLFMAL